MFKSVRYVLKENFTNLYRIFSISKYELLSDMRDSRLGIFWNFANPAIQIATYAFVFGLGIRGNRAVEGIPFLDWMLAGMLVWFYISKCITGGVNSIYEKLNVITKMKFPVSILPATVIFKELFNHFFMIILVFIFYMIRGYSFSIQWFGIFYYTFCVTMFGISLSMVTSVLNMFTRDVKKLVNAFMRMFLYITPILWTVEILPLKYLRILKINPLYYIVEGYRDCFFFHRGFLMYPHRIMGFWAVTIFLFVLGSYLMYKFKHRFIDMI
ncbi:MAG: ABC transporter permease [Erysipelotrichaceae bacterium]